MLFPTWDPAAMFLPLFHRVISHSFQISSATSQGTVLKHCLPKEGKEITIILNRSMGFALSEQGKLPQVLQALNIRYLSPLTTYYFTRDRQAYASAFHLPVTKRACKNDDLQIGLPRSEQSAQLPCSASFKKKKNSCKPSQVQFLCS